MEADGAKKRCNARTEIFSRIVGFYRPVQVWNPGKKSEFKDRGSFEVDGVRPHLQKRA